MLKIAFRLVNAVFAAVAAVTVSSRYGESATGKMLTVLITAGVVALFEWLSIWLPKRSARVRHLLDSRSVFAGVWAQDDVRQFGGDGSDIEIRNRRAILIIRYRRETDDYEVDGAAYTGSGEEHARWESTDVAHFTRNGRAMTYEWVGTITNPELGPEDPRRTGFCRLKLLDDDSGRGRVDHVAVKVVLQFNLVRIAEKWLTDRKLIGFKPESPSSPTERDRLAKALVASASGA